MYIRNISGSQLTIKGKTIEDNEYYFLTKSQQITWSSSETVITNIVNMNIEVCSSENQITSTDINEQIDLLKNLTPKMVQSKNYPFKDKILEDGSKLYIRVHGVEHTVTENGICDFVIPYTNCKINALEIINGRIGDKINLKVLDTDAGLLTGVSNYCLNQFGFDVNISENYYKHSSDYDADLILGMVVRVEYSPVDVNESRKIYLNLNIHEVKP